MKELQVVQTQPELSAKTIEANQDPSYIIPVHEQHLVHAEVSIPQFNPQTGVNEGTKANQTFYPEEFKRIEKEKGFAGMKVRLLHVPAEKTAAPAPTMAGSNESGPAPEETAGSQAAAPLPQSEDIFVDPNTLGVKDLIQLRELMYKDGKSGDLAKADLIADILEKQEFLKAEKQ